MSEVNPPSLDPEPPARPPVDPVSLRPPPPPSSYPPPAYVASPPSKARGLLGRLFVSLVSALLLGSIALNAYLFIFMKNVTSGPWETEYETGEGEQRIAIVPIEGMIDETTVSFVQEVTQQILEKPPAALVLRVDSGGGGVGASDRIWHALQRLRSDPRTKQIPVVASFGSMAASGGYYVSAGCNHIMAEPTTLTGSIGVIAPFMEFSDLLAKIGVTPEVVIASQSPRKDVGSAIRKWTPDDRTRLTQVIDHAHKQFKSIVARGRKDKLKSDIDVLGDGDIFTADEALAEGLVDEIGYIDDAIAKAAALAGLPANVRPRITIFRAPYGVGLLGLIGGRHGQMPTPDDLRSWLWALTEPRLAYRVHP